MFERYNEKARRVIFFARYEANHVGSPYIETEHLLLGLLREDKALTHRFLRPPVSVESIRKQIEQRTTKREAASTASDLPLSNECKRVLAYAAEEAERLGHPYIGTEHLLLGLLREGKCFAAEMLTERGVLLPNVREELQRNPHIVVVQKAQQRHSFQDQPLLAECARDLTQAATESALETLVGREQEIEELLEILCSRNNRNPLLVGESGPSCWAIVEHLAQLIADGEVPTYLESKRVLAIELEQLTEGTANLNQASEKISAMLKELAADKASIAFFPDIQGLPQADPTGVLRRAFLSGQIQCIGTTATADYHATLKAAPWIARFFRPLKIRPMTQEVTVRNLLARKETLEKFHAVSYTDEAVQDAERFSSRYFPHDAVFEKAMDILDAAGTRVKLRQSMLPEEVSEAQKRIKFIVHRMERAIANHEFDKARFYSDEERKERERLKELREKYHLDPSGSSIVTGDEVANLVSRWTSIPIEDVKSGSSGVHEDSGPLAEARQSTAAGSQSRSGLRVFMCHAREDQPAVENLYERLKEHDVEPWLDVEDLMPGQEWRYEIEKAVRATHIVLVCLSARSVTQAGFVQKEIRLALDIADQQPEGSIFVIPVKLEDCVVPDRLGQWHWVNLYEERGFDRLMRALHQRARTIGAQVRQHNASAQIV